MARTNIFIIKASLTILLILISFICFYLSYLEFVKINDEYSYVYDDVDINYFDKKKFQKYYEVINIEILTDPIFDKEKSKNYFENITLENLSNIFDKDLKKEENKNDLIIIDDSRSVKDKKDKEIDENYNEIIVSKGDSFAKVLKKGGLKGRDIDLVILNGKEYYDFSKLYIGDIIKILSEYDDEGLKSFNLIYKYSDTKELIISYLNDKFIYEIIEIPLISEEIFVQGKIKTSLYKAMKDQGLSEIVINEIIRIYSFDIDFQRDIYEGDNFEMLFVKKVNNLGKTIQIEDPKYLMLSSRGTPLIYYLYDTDEFSEYFDEKGKGMTKSLMKTPINGARLSSSYGMRKHPISGYNKMHKGVDFAAPTGTPIFAAGNGVIEYMGRNGGYGKYIRIRHDSTYKTAYAHLNGYKKGISSGVRVKQGDVIGYVGSTGKSTGPHLHYEIIVNGKQINPATLKLPSGRKLNEQQLNEFQTLVLNINEEVVNYKNLVDYAN